MIFFLITKLSHLAPEFRSNFSYYKYELYYIKDVIVAGKKRLSSLLPKIPVDLT